MTPARALPVALLAGLLLVLAQAANHALSEAAAFKQRFALRAQAATPGGLQDTPLALAAYLALGELAPLIPEDGRVLLVAGSEAPVAYDFQLLPRPLHMLLPVSDTLARRVTRIDPVLGARLAEWHAQLETRDQVLTTAALRRHLDRSDWLVTVETEPDQLDWPADGPGREFVARRGPAALYRLLPAP